jgi:hypothetical protein
MVSRNALVGRSMLVGESEVSLVLSFSVKRMAFEAVSWALLALVLGEAYSQGWPAGTP